jgi:hypothetical protein
MQKNGSAKEQQETKKTEYLIEMEKEMKSKKEQMIIISRANEPLAGDTKRRAEKLVAKLQVSLRPPFCAPEAGSLRLSKNP